MPFIMMALAAIGGAIWWWVRSNPREALNVAQNTAETVRNAPRKLAFRKQMNAHPVEGIDDYRIAICALAQAFLELDDLPTREQRQALDVKLRSNLRCTAEESEEMQVLGRWLIGQSGGADQSITRLARRLYALDGDASWDVLQTILTSLVEGQLSPAQASAVEDMRRAMHI